MPVIKPTAEPLHVRFLWAPRRESAEECADRLRLFLRRIDSLDSAFARWYLLDEIDKPRMKPIQQTRKALAALLRQGMIRAQTYPHEPIDDLGFSVSLETFLQPSLDVQCGGYVDSLSNVLLMALPQAGPLVRRMLRVRFLAELCRHVVECWEPDYGSIWSQNLYKQIDMGKAVIDVGWLTYIANSIRSVPRLANGIKVLPIGDLGKLIVTTSEQFQTTNLLHVERARQIWTELNAPMSTNLKR